MMLLISDSSCSCEKRGPSLVIENEQNVGYPNDIRADELRNKSHFQWIFPMDDIPSIFYIVSNKNSEIN